MTVALVTGASRGIGQAAAVELASKGFDVALAARTLAEGDGRDDGDFHRGRPIEGSLETTAAMVEQHGGRAMQVHLDLLDPGSVDTCVDQVLARWGRLDVLVNNATLHTHSNTRICDLSRENIEDFTRATFAGPLLLTKHALAAMVAQGGGRIINVSSAAGLRDPQLAAGEGGWGVLYGMVKAAQYRIPGMVRVEYPDSNIFAFSLNPGFVKTPVIRELPIFRDAGNDLPPSVPGAVIAWLAAASAAAVEPYVGAYLDAPVLAAELGLVPGHGRPRTLEHPMDTDRASPNADLGGLSTGDAVAIHAVVEKYGFLIDDRAFDRLDEVFTEDARVDYRDHRLDPPRGNGPFVGRAEIERQMHVLEHPVQHMLVSHLIDDVSNGEVTVRSKALVPLHDGTIADIEYRDVLVRTALGWRIRDKSIRSHRPLPSG